MPWPDGQSADVMRIAIDARELAGRPTGVGRYLAEILASWAALPAAASHELILCSPAPLDPGRLQGLDVRVLVAPGRGTSWEQLKLPRLVRQVRADVLFAPGYSAPLLAGAPTVLTVHDVSFAAHPEWFTPREGIRRRLFTRASARRAVRVITVSDFSKREIVRHFRIDPGKVEVIYSGATAIARPGSREPLILYVGSVFNRRHIPETIDGFARLARERPEVRLEIVGDNRTYPPIDVDRLVAASGAADRIRIRSYVPDDDLADLYGRASAFVFLSEYEGFGMTPLDALAAGVPPVVLDTEVAREIYGPAALFVERPEADVIHDALRRALFDDDARGRILEAAPRQLARYSWQECGHRTLQVLLASASA